jgi:predicted  nucleic acid-binding Zn-ribbon protein
MQEKYLKSVMVAEALQRELEAQNEVNARLRQQIIDLKSKNQNLEDQMELRVQDRLDVTNDLGRQYKTMQSELISEINRLESTNTELQGKLGSSCLS